VTSGARGRDGRRPEDPVGEGPGGGAGLDDGASPDDAPDGCRRPGPRRVVVRAGNYQSARVGCPFPAQLTVVVVDGRGSTLPGIRVTFAITAGSAAFAHGSRTATSMTGAGGVATSQVLAAGPRTGTVRILATASVVARPTVFALRVLPAPPWRARPEVGRP
jgi:hypothetical protein